MTDLFNSPVLVVEQPSARLAYQIAVPQGLVVAHVAQVGGPQRSPLAQAFTVIDKSRVVLQVVGPDGAPLFFLDRVGWEKGMAQPPCAVVAPDGTLIGSFEWGAKAVRDYVLLDAARSPLCTVYWEPLSVYSATTDDRLKGGNYCIHTDMNGVEIARMDCGGAGFLNSGDVFTLQLRYRLPDPLRLMVIASPIAMDLMYSAIGGG